jgi:NAD(P)-dependent dehydrogenase (short-subunit alcohol dehydrogenase family)
MKSIIVTGASGNLGKSVVTTLHEEGYRVLATFGSNRESGVFDHLANVKTDIVNVLEENNVLQYLAENADFSIHAAVLLVGGFAKGTIEETNVATLDKMYRLNFISAFNIVKPLLTQFEQQGSGQFIFIGARPPLEIAESIDVFAYTMSKTLLFKLADYVNEYGKEKNIKATVLVPTTIDTPQTRQTAAPNTDFSKWITPDVIAQKIAHLVSDTEGGTLKGKIIKLSNNKM